MKRIAVGLMLVPALLAAQAAPAKTDLSGKWQMSVTTDNGTGTPGLTLTQKGDSLSGTYSSQVFGEQAVKGMVSANKVAFSFTASAQGQSITVSFTGAIEADGSLKGTVDLGGFGSGTWTATRSKPPAPDSAAAVATGEIRLGSPVPNAFLYVNDRVIGPISIVAYHKIPAGGARVAIRSVNCATPWDTTVVVQAGQSVTIGRRLPTNCK